MEGLCAGTAHISLACPCAASQPHLIPYTHCFATPQQAANRQTPVHPPPHTHKQVRGGKGRAMGGGGGVGMTPGRSPAYGILASPHPNRGMQQNVMASPSRQGGGGGGPPGSGQYSGRVSTQQVGWGVGCKGRRGRGCVGGLSCCWRIGSQPQLACLQWRPWRLSVLSSPPRPHQPA